MNYTEKDIINEIEVLMNELGIDYFPTHSQMESSKHSRLTSRISRYGGSKYFIEKYNYKPYNSSYLKTYTEQDVINEIKELMKELEIDYFPTRSQIENNPNHKKLISRIARKGGSHYFSEKYNIILKNDISGYNGLYTDDYILSKLNEVIKNKKLNHFPTRQEMIDYFGNNSINALVYRRGGSKFWANKLNIPLKESDTLTGWKGEDLLKEKIQSLGYKIERMSTNNSYDFLVNDCIKIESKFSHLYKGKAGNFYAFNLDSGCHNADIIILLCEDDNKNIKFLVIPCFVVLCQNQISVGEHNSKWYFYNDRFDYIDAYQNFFNSIKEGYIMTNFNFKDVLEIDDESVYSANVVGKTYNASHFTEPFLIEEEMVDSVINKK